MKALAIILFILTLILSAIFSGSETAYISSNRLKWFVRPRLTDEEVPMIWTDQNRFITTVLVGNNVVMVACSSLAVLVFAPVVPDSLLVIFTTFFLLLFGEIIPKTFAQQIPNRLVQQTPRLMHFFYLLLFPFIWIAERATRLLIRMGGESVEEIHKIFHKTDLPFLLHKYSTVDFRANQLIARTIRINHKRLNDFMVPRLEIQAVPIDTPPIKIAKYFKRSGLSRMPVYRSDLDHIIGFIYLLDMLLQSDRPLAELVRPAFFLPEHIKALQALSKMRKTRHSMAILVDEHGGTAGLITIEDLVEQLFGEIFDEFDSHRPTTRVLDEVTIVASGRTEIEFMNDTYKLALPTGDFATIAGLIEAQLGRIPNVDDEVQLAQCKIIVIQADERRVNQVKIIRN
ncbi:MAG TPA: hemolysin family protein [bacterium]|nr:hemolysin family protein [bacterium]HNT65063.1 hemolysin family protein [bacterium]HPG45933.1 hemolysin family protein [bacterium]HPM97755.1 hemolysin family protein [bacterium]